MPLTTSEPRIYYTRVGTGEPLLAILGFAVSSASLDPLAALYSTKLQAITYDHPGTGRSSKAAFPHTTAGLAAAAVRVLDEVGLESAHVAGVSLGGVVAQEMALRFPHRVRGLILVATSPAGPLSTPPDLRAIPAAAALIGGDSVRQRKLALGPAFFSPPFLRDEPARAAELLRHFNLYPATPWGIFGQLLAAGLHDRTLDLHRIRAPTLILHGDDDFLVPLANARLMAERIPDSELHVFAGGRHGFALECAEETFAVMTEWIERRQPQAGERRGRAGENAELLSRQLAVPLGYMRLGRSSAVLAGRALARLVGRI